MKWLCAFLRQFCWAIESRKCKSNFEGFSISVCVCLCVCIVCCVFVRVFCARACESVSNHFEMICRRLNERHDNAFDICILIFELIKNNYASFDNGGGGWLRNVFGSIPFANHLVVIIGLFFFFIKFIWFFFSCLLLFDTRN